MLRIEFGPSDLASVRFGVSPLIELWQSVRVLQSPVAGTLHSTWLRDARARVKDLDLTMLYALQPPHGCSPDFIHPPPEGPCGELEPELADLARRYWQRVLAPHWERIRTRLEGDVLWRAQQAAAGGLRALFADLDRSIRFHDDHLLIDKSWHGSLDLHGRGLLLVPSVFVWPAVAILERDPWPPTLIYPARGCGLVWEPVQAAPDGLAALLGSRRAAILASLERPCSTTDLACRLEVIPSSISQHLTVLHEAGLIERHRVGRVVLYRRSPAGDVLLGANRTTVRGLEAA